MAELDQHRNGKKGKAANKKECHRYIRNRPVQFGYAAAKAANLPIGSGEIESSNSAVVQMRLKIPGGLVEAFKRLGNALFKNITF